MLRSRFYPDYFLFDANTDGGAGGGTSTGEGGAGEGQGEAGGTTGGTQGGGTTTPPAGQFTQADLDRIAGNTRKEAMAKFAKENGFENVEALKAVIKAQKDAEDAAKSELQKAQERAAQAEQKAAQVETALRQTRIQTAVLMKAGELNFANPADAMALLDLSGVQIDEAGKISGHEKLLEELAKSNRLPMKNQQQGAGLGNQTRTRPGAGSQQNNQGGEQPQRPIIGF